MGKVETNRIMLGVITAILILGVMNIAKVILIPTAISVFVAFLLIPLINWLSRRKVPIVLSSLISLGVVVLGIFLLSLLFTVSLKSLNKELPFYVQRMRELVASLIVYLREFGVEVNAAEILTELDTAQVAGVVGKGMMSLVGIVSNLALITFITLFLLIESGRFKEKAARAFGENSPLSSSTKTIAEQIQKYIIWKTIISFGTGFFVWLFLAIVGVDFALLWGLLAFALNFIPSIGSIIASIPPVLIALLQFDNPLLYALVVLIGLGAIQLFIGSFLDPRILGKELNLSPLVVFLNMLFWGFMWGPIGMILATPLIVCLKVIFAQNEDLKPIVAMLEG
ncbi:MAG: AI-2E family transporter [Myxococcota bacterium]